jgi:hypothetical protein
VLTPVAAILSAVAAATWALGHSSRRVSWRHGAVAWAVRLTVSPFLVLLATLPLAYGFLALLPGDI